MAQRNIQKIKLPINALEKLGMKFARDVNAFTPDFENTVYALQFGISTISKKLELAFDVTA